jgi:hypothetical protein
MNNPWVRRLLRLAAFCPALLLGAWLVNYTQRQAARPPSVEFNHQLDRLILEARAEAAENAAAEIAEFEGFIHYGEPIYTSKGTTPLPPHVIRVTSKRIEMPVFNTRKVTTPPTAWDGAPATAATDRKGIEPWLADFVDRLSRSFGGKSPSPP